MKTTIALSALSVIMLHAGTVLAAETADGKPQTTRMSECSAQAKEKGLKGEARKEHMSQCLRKPGAQAAAKECNASATERGLKGERRKDFVAECVKAKSAAGSVG
jgi:hypothetical protein